MQTDGGVLYTQIEGQLPGFIQTNHGKFTKFVEKYYEFLELNLLTFTEVNLNEDKPIQESADVTYTVSVTTGNNDFSANTNKFYLDGAVSPDLTIDPTKKTIFDQGDISLLTHYLRISDTPDGVWGVGGEENANTEVTYFSGSQEVLFQDEAGNQFVSEDGLYDFVSELDDVARTIIEPNPDNAGKTFYYYCNTHSGMGGTIVFSDISSYISLENGNTESANVSTDYIDYENPNRQGEQFLSGETLLGANSGAQGVVRGKYSTTQAYVQETNNGSFQVGETITGLESRVSANVSSYSRQPINASRNVKAFQDVDKAPVGFVELFRKEFLQGLPTDMLSRKQDALKRIKDFYRAKGNEDSFRYIFRLLYAKENITFYYPGTDILRLSDGRWTLDKSVKIATSLANNIGAFVGRKIVGEVSNVTALVERSESYQIGATGVTELYISGIDANNAVGGYSTFKVDELLTTTTADDDGNYGSANTTGVLSGVTIDAGGSNYLVGDDVLVSGGGGSEAAAKVASISDATISQFDLIDAGDGYTVGDTVSFVNEGTGGTGGAARVNSIIPTFTTVHISDIINTFKDNKIDAAAYSAPWAGYTRNNHITSNSTTTFDVGYDGLSGSAPKVGDLIISFQHPQMLLESGEGNIGFETNSANLGSLGIGTADRVLTENTTGVTDANGFETIASYTPDRSIFATVIAATGSTVTYAQGSVITSSLTGEVTIRGFSDNDVVTIFDLTKKADGTAITSTGNGAAFYATGATFNINGTPTSNTETAATSGMASVTDIQLGAIRGIQILSSGQGYESIPQVSVANTITESYKADVSKTGANSVFVKLASATANLFTANTRIENDAQTAVGFVLDYIDKPTTTQLATGGSVTLVATGNTHLRVQMTTANSFAAEETLTIYKNEAGGAPIGVGDFTTANIEVSSETTGTFTQAIHGYSAGEKVVITNVTGQDDNVFNNTYTIATVPTTNTYTVTLSSAPTRQSVNNATIRKVVTANTSSTNTVFANTGIPGNNATISIASIAIGAIESLTITNFGASYTTAPTLDATGSGDGNATLSAQLGALAEYAGYFDGNYGLLSTTNKFQDNYYYQDFSYVIKTDVDVKTYRDKILNLVHPAGMFLFGEIAITSDSSARMFDNATRNAASTIANTQHGIDVPLYQHHDIKILGSSNLVHSIAESMHKTILFPPNALRAIDATVESPHTDFELIMERNIDGIAFEEHGDAFIHEGVGEFLLENDTGGRDRIISETVDYILNEDGTVIVHELKDDTIQLVMEQGGYYIVEVAILQSESGYTLVEEQYGARFESEAGEGGRRFTVAHSASSLGGLAEGTTYMRAEVSTGGGIPVSTADVGNRLAYFQLEYTGQSPIRIMQEQDDPSYILNENTDFQIIQEEDFGSISLESSKTDLITLEDGTGVIDLEGDGGYILIDQDNALSQNRILYEEEKISYHVVNSHPQDEFYITAENNGDFYFIRQEGISSADYGDFIFLEDGRVTADSIDGGRLFGFEASDERDYITLERSDWVSDTTMKGEETIPFGYSLPIIQMPYAETGSVKIDFGPAYDLLLEDGSYLILEDPNAQAYPTYLAFENTMQEEISKDYVVTVSTGTANLADMIGLEDGTGVIEIEGGLDKILSEAGGDVMLDVRRDPIAFEITPKVTVSAVTSDLILEDGFGSVVLEDSEYTMDLSRSIIRLEEELLPFVSLTSGSSQFQHAATWGRIDEYTILGSLISAQVGGKEEFVAFESVDIAQAGVVLLEDDTGKMITERSVIPSFPDVQPLEINIPLSSTLDQAPGDEVALEDGSGAVKLEGDYIGLEDGTGGIALNHTYGRLTEEDFGRLATERRRLLNEMNWARAESDGAVSNYLYEARGELQLTGGEEYELLAENGDKFVTQSVETFLSVSAFTTELGEYLVQESDQSSRIIGEFSADIDQTAKILSADYGRKNEVIGTNTSFEIDFASPLTLEDYEDHLYSASGGGTILLERVTSQDYLLVLENSNDRIYDSFILETNTTGGPGRVSSEETIQNETARLVYHDLLDLVTEEDNILTEELDNILFEDHLIVPTDVSSFLAENNDDFILEHDVRNNYAAQLLGYGIENVVQEFRISDLVADIGLEFDGDKGELPGSILMERYTPHNTLDGQIVVGANTYVKSWSDALLVQSSTTVSLVDGVAFPYGVEGGTLRYANGTVTDITNLNNNMTQLTVGNSATVDDPGQTFRIYYGSDEAVPVDTPRKMKCEIGTTDTNDAGREYQFIINDWVGLTIQSLHERHGNDIVFEDGERMLIEDGEITQTENAMLLEDDTGKLGYEGDNNLLFEDMHYNEKMLIHDAERFRIKEIANNTSMIMSSTETDVQTPRSDVTFFIEREGRITS